MGFCDEFFNDFGNDLWVVILLAFNCAYYCVNNSNSYSYYYYRGRKGNARQDLKKGKLISSQVKSERALLTAAAKKKNLLL